MESADDVRASLAVAALADVREHEAASESSEARVRALLSGAGVLSWPLLVDGESGLLLDGTHRARVLRREYGARFVVVQRVALMDPAVRLGTWCRVLEPVPPSRFERARRALGLVADGDGVLACHYGGRVFTRPDADLLRAYALAGELERLLTSNGHGARVSFVEDAEARAVPPASGAVVLRLPALDKGTLRRRVHDGLLPPKSTRFLPPYRLIGLGIGLDALAGPPARLAAALERARRAPVMCLGPDLTVDRRYPERLWQFSEYRIPDRLFADAAGRRAYASALARAALPGARRA